MNNEIEQLLIQLEYFIEENYKYYNDVELNKNQIKQLLDYITNLQQENKRLKETNVYCNRTDCVGRIKDSIKYDSVYQEKEDYKSRCEKVDEIIKKEKEIMGYAKYDSCLLLIENIVKNGSEENDKR